jgi:hypothetical protein
MTKDKVYFTCLVTELAKQAGSAGTTMINNSRSEVDFCIPSNSHISNKLPQ